MKFKTPPAPSKTPAKAGDMLRDAVSRVDGDAVRDRLSQIVERSENSTLVRSGLAAGAALVALSAASAATSAVRRRAEGA